MKTRLTIAIILVGLIFIEAKNQSINLIFSAQDSITTGSVLLDSVVVYNITSDCDTIVFGPDPSLLLFPVGIIEPGNRPSNQIILHPPFPNPANGSALFDIVLMKDGPAEIIMFNLSGAILFKGQFVLQQGLQRFKLESSERGIVFIHVSTASYSQTTKLINLGKLFSKNEISYQGLQETVSNSVKSSGNFIYNMGDLLSYKVVKNGYFTEINQDIPIIDTTYVFQMNPLIDGWYISGGATACPEISAIGMMHITRNEVTQALDPNVLELYIPVLAGAAGFNIVKVYGGTTTTYGPSFDFITITNGGPEEPKVPFQRGSYEESEVLFTVPENGMYHVAIFLITRKVVVVPVHWGMIGSATVNAWNSSVPMEESSFDLNTMSWEIDSVTLYNGDWKFRYSDGWKVFLDTTYNLGNGLIGVGVNANFGESVDSLVPGGANISNTVQGIYNAILDYHLGLGYLASLTFIDTIPVTNWVGVVCDAVGTGISPDNPNAIPDPSSWNWGYQLIADNGGVPGYVGNFYTWTWEGIVLEAWEGFLLRTLNGLPSPINNQLFEAGYLDLNIAASTPYIISSGAPYNNLMATMKANYSIVLHLDAGNNNTREIIITLD